MPTNFNTKLKKNHPLHFPCPKMNKQAGIWWKQAIAMDAVHQESLKTPAQPSELNRSS